MDVERVLHMNEGLGEASYAQNSSIQKRTTDVVKDVIIDSAVDSFLSLSPKCFSLADLGCSSGPNALSLSGEIIDAIDRKCEEVSKPKPKIMMHLNDLPSNDFNSTFMNIGDFISSRRRGRSPDIFLAGVPGSFYGRLFPSNSLHFALCTHSLHWLSQVPPGVFNEKGEPLNKGKIYISETSPPCVAHAYFQQFQKDFNIFLKSRSKEMIPDGKLVLLTSGRVNENPHNRQTTILWQLLAESFSIMVSLGKIKENEADMYNIPFYVPSLKQVKDEVHKEGSFTVECFEAFEGELGNGDAKQDGRNLANAIRAVQESMICRCVGTEVIDDLFEIYSELLHNQMVKEKITYTQVIIVLRNRKLHKIEKMIN